MRLLLAINYIYITLKKGDHKVSNVAVTCACIYNDNNNMYTNH